MNGIISKICFNVKQRGLFNLLFLTIFKSIHKIISFELLVFFEKSLTGPQKELNSKINVNFSHAYFDDLRHLNPKEYQLTGLESYEIENDCTCYIGMYNKIVFYIWVSYKNIYDDKIFNIALSSKQAYLYRAFTHPDYRGLKIYPAGLSHVCRELQKQNINKCYIAASIENRPSISGIIKAGFIKVGYIMYFKVAHYKKVILPKIFQTVATDA